MAWLWLLVCWGCLLAGFVLGAWWATARYHDREADRDFYTESLERELRHKDDELQMVRDIRQMEWRQKLEAGDA
jgi:hypothetical protein